MTRLIDAEKLKAHYAWWEDDERRTLFDQIVDAQPAVDAEPVIRCKDCLFGERWAPDKCYCNGFLKSWVDEDDFCAWAYKKVKR